MKALKWIAPLALLLALGFALAGCPKDDKMMDARPNPSAAASHVG